MTNATVGTVTKAAQGAVLHITFTGGESEYSIGPDVPILANAPGDMSLLKPDAAVWWSLSGFQRRLHRCAS